MSSGAVTAVSFIYATQSMRCFMPPSQTRLSAWLLRCSGRAVPRVRARTTLGSGADRLAIPIARRPLGFVDHARRCTRKRPQLRACARAGLRVVGISAFLHCARVSRLDAHCC